MNSPKKLESSRLGNADIKLNATAALRARLSDASHGLYGSLYYVRGYPHLTALEPELQTAIHVVASLQQRARDLLSDEGKTQ